MAKKWFPGHYGYATDNTTHTGIMDSWRNIFKGNPYFTGYHCQYWWYKLEPSKGVYDFSMIVADLAKCRADGKKMALKFYDRVFNTTKALNLDQWPCPRYIVKTDDPDYDPSYEGGYYVNVAANVTAPKLWVSAVAERQLLLLEALAAELDGDPDVSIMLLTEIALAGREAIAGYSDQRYHDTLRAMNNRVAAAFVETPVVQWVNFGLTDALRDSLMVNIVETNKSGFGTPDTYNRPGGALTNNFGEYYGTYAGVAHKYASVEWSGYDVDIPPAEILDYGVDQLGLNFMAWLPRIVGVSGDIYDAIDAINAQQGRINTAKPTNITYFDDIEPPPDPDPIIRGPYQGVTRQLPGTIPATAWDAMMQGGVEVPGEGVTYHDTAPASAFGSPVRSVAAANYPQTTSVDGNRVRLQKIGEWREHTISIATTGTYRPSVTICAPSAPPSPAVRFWLDGVVIAEFGAGSTGDWTHAGRQTFYGDPVALTAAASAVLRFEVLSEGWDVFDFTYEFTEEPPVDPPVDPDPPVPGVRWDRRNGKRVLVIGPFGS